MEEFYKKIYRNKLIDLLISVIKKILMLGIKSKSSPKTWRSSMNNSPRKGDDKIKKKNVGNLINSEEELNLKYHY
jgi:hypothetical protein